MKQILMMVFSAMLGGALVIAMAQDRIVQPTRFGKVEAQEITLVDSAGSTVAKLGTEGGRTALSFYGQDNQPSIEIGLDRNTTKRFIHFLGKQKRGVAALVSEGPYGESTLYLGDERWEGRAVLGALQTDTPGAPVDDWGLRFPVHGSNRPMFGILLHDEKGKTEASIQLRKSNGETWIVY